MHFTSARLRLLATLAVAATLGTAQLANAGDPVLHINGLALNPGANEADEVAAADALMASEAAKGLPWRVTLYRTIAAGNDPTTHSYAISSPSAESAETANAKLTASPAWATYAAAAGSHATSVSSTRFRTVRTWGDVNDTDAVWTVVMLRISDTQRFLTARARFEASPTGKKFPGQWHMNAVVAGGISPVTHQVAQGFASEAEADAWATAQRASGDWQAYLNETRDVTEALGFTMHRMVKAWGPPLKDVLAR